MTWQKAVPLNSRRRAIVRTDPAGGIFLSVGMPGSPPEIEAGPLTANMAGDLGHALTEAVEKPRGDY